MTIMAVPWLFFELLLALYLDDQMQIIFPEHWGLYVVFFPLYITWYILWKSYRHLPYVWEPIYHSDWSDVDSELAAELAARRGDYVL